MWGTKIKDLPFKLVVQSEIEIWRAADFWTKEPETIAWIDSFAPGSVFWDIGANVGVFSLYAATKNLKSCIAFEPENKNYCACRANVYANIDMTGSVFDEWDVKPYALSDTDVKSTFHVHHSGGGHSGGQIGAAVDESGREFKPVESYEVETYRIDTLSERLGVPNHIKIDVDGHEWEILGGGLKTLGNDAVKSVLVEVNNNYDKVNMFMTNRGFSDFNRFNGKDINRRADQKSRNVIYLRENT
jgi:FkbM family methyltransferase